MGKTSPGIETDGMAAGIRASRVIAVVNQKGGVGKSTTAISLAYALGREPYNYRVLLVDLDPQASLSQCLGLPVNGSGEGESVYGVLRGEVELASVITEPAMSQDALDGSAGAGLVHVVPAELAMSTVERDLADRKVGAESILSKALEPVRDSYDYILLDCRPSTEQLEVNAMRAADYLLIPVLSEVATLFGTDQLIDLYSGVKEHYNPDLQILGVLLTKVDRRTRLAGQVSEQVRAYFGEKTFDTEIRINVQLAETPGEGKSIFDYAPKSRGAEDYRKLAEEVIRRAV